MALVRVRVEVEGRVQGVWFRESTRRAAEEIGVSGWVRNRSDGSVEAVFEGDERDVAQAVEWARLGPPRALVTSLREFAEQPEGLGGFEVLD
jgi:acylphosphatase